MNGAYKCIKCNIESPYFKWVYLLVFQIADFTRSQWVTAFSETAESLIGKSANDLEIIKRENYDEYLEILNNLNLKSYIFKLRSNFETYIDDTHLKTSVLSFSPVKPILYIEKLLKDIKSVGRLLHS